MIETLDDLQQLVVCSTTDKKAFDIIILDLRTRSDLTDFFVICSGNSRMQVQAIADSVLDRVCKSRHKVSSIEGYTSGNWVVLDLVDIVVHVFHKDFRAQYDLERLWGDVPSVDIASKKSKWKDNFYE